MVVLSQQMGWLRLARPSLSPHMAPACSRRQVSSWLPLASTTALRLKQQQQHPQRIAYRPRVSCHIHNVDGGLTSLGKRHHTTTPWQTFRSCALLGQQPHRLRLIRLHSPDTSSWLLLRTSHAPSSLLTSLCRAKHTGSGNKRAKTGQHLETLEELAHRPEHDHAVQRRQKRKEKQDLKSKHGGKSSIVQDGTPIIPDQSLEHDDEGEEENEQDDAGSNPLPDVTAVQARMMQTVTKFQSACQGIRGAEPTPELFDRIHVQAYGTAVPLQSVAQVVITSPTLVTATCFDPSLAKSVRDAIMTQLELNPILVEEEPGLVRIPVPRVSLERRQQTAAAVRKLQEQSKQRIRRIRRQAMDRIKTAMAGHVAGISQDDAYRASQQLEHATEQADAALHAMTEQKLRFILEVT